MGAWPSHSDAVSQTPFSHILTSLGAAPWVRRDKKSGSLRSTLTNDPQLLNVSSPKMLYNEV